MSAEFVYELDRIDFKNSTGKDIIGFGGDFYCCCFFTYLTFFDT